MTTLDWEVGARLRSSSFPGSCDISEPKFLEKAPTHCHLALTELMLFIIHTKKVLGEAGCPSTSKHNYCFIKDGLHVWLVIMIMTLLTPLIG